MLANHGVHFVKFDIDVWIVAKVIYHLTMELEANSQKKTDVYSFGVVVLEIISARMNIDPNMPLDAMYLLEKANP